MEIKIVKQEKNSVEVSLDNPTVAEAMRAYINSEGGDFAAWRREHPSKPVLLKIDDEKGVGKAVSAAASALRKDISVLRAMIKK